MKDFISSNGGKAFFLIAGAALGAILLWKWSYPLLGEDIPEYVTYLVYTCGIGIGGWLAHSIWSAFNWFRNIVCGFWSEHIKKIRAKEEYNRLKQKAKDEKLIQREDIARKWQLYRQDEQRDLILLVGQAESRYSSQIARDILNRFGDYFDIQWQQKNTLGDTDYILKPKSQLADYVTDLRRGIVQKELEIINASPRLQHILSLFTEVNEDIYDQVTSAEFHDAELTILEVSSRCIDEESINFVYPLDKLLLEQLTGRKYKLQRHLPHLAPQVE